MSEKKATRSGKSTRAAKLTSAAETMPAVHQQVIELEATMTIVQAAVFHRTLAGRLALAEPMVLDGSQVAEIDTAILQLLTNLWRTCGQRGIACTWLAASHTLRRTAVLLGIHDMLCFPTEPA